MTDVAPAEAPKPLPPEVQQALDAIQADRTARREQAAAEAQAEGERVDKLAAAKQECLDKCGPISEAIANAADEEERQALVQLEEQTHAGHAEALRAAYQEFSGQREGDSNPAPPGETLIESRSDAVADASA